MRDEMQEIFGELFDDVFAESVTAFTGEYMGPGVFDPVTEETTAQPVVYAGRGVFHEYDEKRVDGLNIKFGDIQLIALTNEVAGRPDIGHLVETADNVGILGMPAKGYRIVRVGGDPGGVHHDLQLRKA
ncbi:hypothetical protein AS889_04575 [Pseudomonas putida]|uniref:hypothetical protein n=1 Tax=Pseudomonas putida TaxID=303 RepID=UPI0007716B8A|nr:hypothetical protein [Pseudomonas putida]KWW18807.1 hypothetical protein AS889_04575 [Pseudomonas putida]